MRKVLLKPAAILLFLPDGEPESVLHFQTGDAISVHADYPGLEKGKPYPIISYAHTPDGTHVCLPGCTPKAYRVHSEFPEGESREYFLKKMPEKVTELCLPQVVNEIRFHPVKSAAKPAMRVSYSNPEKELPIIHGDFKEAA